FPLSGPGSCPGSHFQWCFSQVDGAIEEDMTEDLPQGRADIISTIEFNYSGAPVAEDKDGRVIFQQEVENKSCPHSRGEYNVYSTFKGYKPGFGY
uniref:Uncharacterized protein n=1 Tax=Piliocolobus tephrosceles TaxID=591936 RepID=A0A8C9HI00_9PRIM